MPGLAGIAINRDLPGEILAVIAFHGEAELAGIVLEVFYIRGTKDKILTTRRTDEPGINRQVLVDGQNAECITLNIQSVFFDATGGDFDFKRQQARSGSLNGDTRGYAFRFYGAGNTQIEQSCITGLPINDQGGGLSVTSEGEHGQGGVLERDVVGQFDLMRKGIGGITRQSDGRAVFEFCDGFVAGLILQKDKRAGRATAHALTTDARAFGKILIIGTGIRAGRENGGKAISQLVGPLHTIIHGA